MYQIISIKNNRLYKIAEMGSNSVQVVDRVTCLRLAKRGLITNATCQNNSLRGKGCNLKELNKTNTSEVELDKGVLANALSNWVYEQDNTGLKLYYDSLSKPLNGIFYRGRIIHKSMLEVGKKLYLTSGLVSWTTSQGVAENFADTHMEHAEEERFDLQADLSEYEPVILCIKSTNGSIKGIDIIKSVLKYEENIDEEVVELAESEYEILLFCNRQPELTIVKIEKIRGYYKLYCNIK